MPDRKLRVFLCHASQDKPVVRAVYQKLLAESWMKRNNKGKSLSPDMAGYAIGVIVREL